MSGRLVRGDVLRCVKSFTNRDLLRRGDIAIVLSSGDDGCVQILNLMRGSGDYGYAPTSFKKIGRNIQPQMIGVMP